MGIKSDIGNSKNHEKSSVLSTIQYMYKHVQCKGNTKTLQWQLLDLFFRTTGPISTKHGT